VNGYGATARQLDRDATQAETVKMTGGVRPGATGAAPAASDPARPAGFRPGWHLLRRWAICLELGGGTSPQHIFSP